jgi:leucine-rich repeat protein SHOC2
MDHNDQEESFRSCCAGGQHCLKLHDKKHSCKFIHNIPKNFEENIAQCNYAKNPTLLLTLRGSSAPTTVPNSLSKLTHLRVLKLIGCGQIVNVNAISSLQSQLQTCVIDCVQLTPNLSDESNAIYTLTSLRHLELNIIEIGGLHDAISKLMSIHTLLIANLRISEFPSTITRLSSLRHLSLHNVVILQDTFVFDICKLSSLHVLEITFTRQLRRVPPDISNLTSLQRLSFLKSGVTSLPTAVSALTQLNSLDLGDCHSLERIPSELGHLKNLTEFQMCRTKAKAIPFTMSTWTNLQVLALSGCLLGAIPSEVWLLTDLRSLALTENNLISVPSDISRLCSLTYLNLSVNQITRVAPQISRLTQLQSLNLFSNCLTEYSVDVALFRDLSVFRIHQNKISTFPPSLPTRLVHGNFSDNLLSSVSANSFPFLANLRVLCLGFNQITLLPTEFGLLASLQYLYLNNNKLSFLPSDLPSELHLDVRANNLRYIPLWQLTSLRRCDCSENSLKYPPAAVREWKEFIVVDRDLYRDT